MASNTAISMQGVSKQYMLRNSAPARYQTLRDGMAAQIKHLLGIQTSPGTGEKRTPFWALKDVSLEVQRGDVVGIIGRNGAGKSTLLKILSRITEPTTGRVVLHGRVASLLEVGTGFHPELTGRENIFLNGAILGMSRQEIREKFDEIIDFAEVRTFLDTPVKHYSSGMYVRLAFSVAAHLEPEILIVDEVLAVGDAAFQRKCLGKINEVSRSGRTVLLVSHNMGAVSSLCTTCIWLDEGKIKEQGATRETIASYLNNSGRALAERRWSTDNAPGDASICRLLSIRLRQPTHSPVCVTDITLPTLIEVELQVSKSLREVGLTLFIKDRDGRVILHTCDLFGSLDRTRTPGRYRYVCELPPFALNCGTYSISLAADIPNERLIFSLEQVLDWEAVSTSPEMGRYRPDTWSGVLGPGLARWSVTPASTDA